MIVPKLNISTHNLLGEQSPEEEKNGTMDQASALGLNAATKHPEDRTRQHGRKELGEEIQRKTAARVCVACTPS